MKIFHHRPFCPLLCPSWLPAPQPPPSQSPGHLFFLELCSLSPFMLSLLLSPVLVTSTLHWPDSCLHDCNLIPPSLCGQASPGIPSFTCCSVPCPVHGTLWPSQQSHDMRVILSQLDRTSLGQSCVLPPPATLVTMFIILTKGLACSKTLSGLLLPAEPNSLLSHPQTCSQASAI